MGHGVEGREADERLIRVVRERHRRTVAECALRD
jgi:hypothetical protein